MTIVRRLRWLPNALTISRIVLAFVVLALLTRHGGRAAFFCFVVALITDFLDGWVARRLHAQSDFGEQLEGLADASLALAGLVGLSLAHHLSWYITGFVLVFTAAIGSDRIFPNQPTGSWRMVLAVGSLFVAWIAIAWMLATLAFGWSWVYLPLTLVILTICGWLKRYRIQAWLTSR